MTQKKHSSSGSPKKKLQVSKTTLRDLTVQAEKSKDVRGGGMSTTVATRCGRTC